MTPLVLRLVRREYALNTLKQALTRSKGSYDFFDWQFQCVGPEVSVEGPISARPEHFVALRYDNPPGGFKTCLNSKLGRAVVRVALPGEEPRELRTAHRAA